jgi:formamidopyrimidine-DNA glycosylase
VVLDQGDALESYFAERLGVEPLSTELTPRRLLELSSGRKAPLKSFLLTQSAVAGIGNIYADEALWRAELHPLSPAGSMKLEHAERLVEGIVQALEFALEHRGASIDDYRDPRGEKGSMQDEFLVHTREGEQCLRGDGVIQRIVVSGRSTYFCPGCQQRLRRRPRRRARKRAKQPAGA